MVTNVAPPGPGAISVGHGAFRIDDRATSLYGAAVHYWRLDRDKWDGILDSVVGMGFTTISIYMPWEVHEIERGRFDFGQIDPRKDLDAFLTLIESKGLDIVARPGPQINSELTWFGYPGRILADPELQALNGQGTMAVLTQVPRPIPAVSYSSEKFFAETALWYDAIMPILAKHVYPKGRLVAAQVDNEMAFFFHINAYACDFSPSSIAAVPDVPRAAIRHRRRAQRGLWHATVARSRRSIPRAASPRVGQPGHPVPRRLGHVPRAVSHRQHDPARRA